MMNLYSTLVKIQKRPVLCGIQKVEDIYMLLMGYTLALDNFKVVDADEQDFNKNFTQFVIDDYNAPSHCNWCTAIRLYSTSDSASVELFFEELAKYKSGETDFDRIKFREENKIFCCQQMADQIKKDTEGIIKYDNEQVIINSYGTGNYSISNADEKEISIKNCPWCGIKLKA
jgi:hypothetical protein